MVFPIFDLLNKRGSQRDLSEIQLDTKTNLEEYTYKRNFKKRFKGIQERNEGGGRDHEGLERGSERISKEFETYSNRKVEKGFASPLR